MSLVAGPGIGGSQSSTSQPSAELALAVEQHVQYIQALDSVGQFVSH
jgi:hypothetical protein